MKLVAVKSFTYAGKRVNVGDIFEAKTNRDAKLLVGIKSARHLEDRPEVKIPEPPNKIFEKLSSKPVKEEVTEEAKPEIKLDDLEKEEKKEKEDEPTVEEIKEPVETPKPTKSPEPSKPTTNKRTYNRKN